MEVLQLEIEDQLLPMWQRCVEGVRVLKFRVQASPAKTMFRQRQRLVPLRPVLREKLPVVLDVLDLVMRQILH